MKYTVKIDHELFEVEIEDLRARPVVVFVDGEPIEVWPESDGPSSRPAKPSQPVPAAPAVAPQTGTAPPNHQPVHNYNGGVAKPANGILSVVRAPIPGVITAVDVQVGSEVKAGQQLCVLEAMKMNNSIRSSRDGQIAVVHVIVGQHVRHHDPLVEFAED